MFMHISLIECSLSDGTPKTEIESVMCFHELGHDTYIRPFNSIVSLAGGLVVLIRPNQRGATLIWPASYSSAIFELVSFPVEDTFISFGGIRYEY